MNQVQHTPGPWEVVAGDDYFIAADGYPTEFPHKFKSDDLGSALAYVGNRPGDFGQANARLIAAAPALLATLTKLLDHIDNEGPAAKGWEAITATCEEGRAIVAKATGADR